MLSYNTRSWKENQVGGKTVLPYQFSVAQRLEKKESGVDNPFLFPIQCFCEPYGGLKQVRCLHLLLLPTYCVQGAI